MHRPLIVLGRHSESVEANMSETNLPFRWRAQILTFARNANQQ